MISRYGYSTDFCPSEKRNVIDKYKQWVDAEVEADLQKNRTEMVSIFLNLDHNINIASAIRANNAFLGKEVYIVGRKKWDRRGAVGSHRYEHVYHADDFDEVLDYLHFLGYIVFAIDNIEKYHPENIFQAEIPKKSAFLFGNEGSGIPEDVISKCDKTLYIQQFGSVRSLNVSQAAACIMMEYSRRFRI